MNGYDVKLLAAVPLPLRKALPFRLTQNRFAARPEAEPQRTRDTAGKPKALRKESGKAAYYLLLQKLEPATAEISTHHEGAHELGHHKSTTT